MAGAKAGADDVGARIRKGLSDALERHGADIVHIGVFDFATAFRERRLRRAEALESADVASFANVAAKWDSAEKLLFPRTLRQRKGQL